MFFKGRIKFMKLAEDYYYYQIFWIIIIIKFFHKQN